MSSLIWGLVFSVAYAMAPATTTVEFEIKPPPPPTVDEIVVAAAKRHGVRPEAMLAVQNCENVHDDPLLQSYHPGNGPNGREDSWGIMQINVYWNTDVSRAEAQDPYFAAEWSAKKFAEGKAHLWTCYGLVGSPRVL